MQMSAKLELVCMCCCLVAQKRLLGIARAGLQVLLLGSTGTASG